MSDEKEPAAEKPAVTEQELRQILANGVVHLRFVKKDGSSRDMYATTVSSLMPEEKRPKAPKNQVGDFVSLFDLELKDWRSLKVSKVLEVEHVPLAVWLLKDMRNKNEN